MRIEVLRYIAGHDHQHRDLPLVVAPGLMLVAEGLENQPLIQCPKTGTDIPQIIGRSQNQPVGLTDLLQNGCKSVLINALAQICRQLAAEAGDAAGEFVQLIKVDDFDFSTLSLCTAGGLLNQRRGIPAGAGTGIDGDDLFLNLGEITR